MKKINDPLCGSSLKERLNHSNQWKMLLFFVDKLVQLCAVLLSVSFITFLLMDLAPGEPGISLYEAAGIIPTEEMLAVTREQLGLNEPLLQRYVDWLQACLQGDLGTSFSQHDEVSNLIAKNMKSTLTLALWIMAITLITSLPLGILAAVTRDKIPDYVIRYTSFITISSPNFLVALVLTYIFCYQLNWIPVYNPYGSKTALILPVLTLSLGMISHFTRQIRAFVLDELSQDYVYGARARGVSELRILFHHVMRNIMLPLMTLVAFSLGSLLGGVAIVEVIFSFPGLGNLMIFAVEMRDYPLIQGLVLWVALCYTVLNILTDVLYQFFDPRLKRQKRGEPCQH